MKIPTKIVETIEVNSILVHAKVRDSCSYALLGVEGNEVATIDDEYVPEFFPEEHFGDYLILEIELSTGQILNWKVPEPAEVGKEFGLIDDYGE